MKVLFNSWAEFIWKKSRYWYKGEKRLAKMEIENDFTERGLCKPIWCHPLKG